MFCALYGNCAHIERRKCFSYLQKKEILQRKRGFVFISDPRRF